MSRNLLVKLSTESKFHLKLYSHMLAGLVSFSWELGILSLYLRRTPDTFSYPCKGLRSFFYTFYNYINLKSENKKVTTSIGKTKPRLPWHWPSLYKVQTSIQYVFIADFVNSMINFSNLENDLNVSEKIMYKKVLCKNLS